MSSRIGRREFLRASAAVSVAGPLMARAVDGNASPLRIGFIGVGNRGTYLLRLALNDRIEVPAICDIQESHLKRALDLVTAKREGRRPVGYSRGPTDYRRMLQRDDLDAVIIATPMQLHGTMAIDALRAGKHVLSEVAAAVTMAECWGLVRAARETGKIYMLAENCCYWPNVTTILNMARKGIFGQLTYAECGYVHDCRALLFDSQGKLTWRGELARDCSGNWYPTHSLGPVAQWMNINRGDRMVSLSAMQTGHAGLDHFIAKRFPADHPLRKVQFQAGDSTTALIRTAKGALIDLRFDLFSARPHPSTTYYALQGTKASYESRVDGIWIEGRTKGLKWEPFKPYTEEFEHPLWKQYREKAAGTGHGGGDFFVMHEFLQSVRTGKAPRVDVYDAAAWSSIIPLSVASIAAGGKPVEIPDFTEGAWEKRSW